MEIEEIDAFEEKYPELYTLLAGCFGSEDEISDEEVIVKHYEDSPKDLLLIIKEGKALLENDSRFHGGIGDLANRYFETTKENTEWLSELITLAEKIYNKIHP